MKKLVCCLISFLLFVCFNIVFAQGVIDRMKQKTKDKVNQRVDEKADKAIDKGLDKTEEAVKGNKNEKKESDRKEKEDAGNNAEKNKQEAPSFKSYQNYDFIPGDKILFEDHFTDDQDGEFATHWELKSGQAVLNKINDQLALHLIDGNYVRVAPRMKIEKYFTNPFTIECDYYFISGAYGLGIMLKYLDKEDGYEKETSIFINAAEVQFTGKQSYSKDLPVEIKDENFVDKWHHIAIAYKDRQLKIYIDQFRVLVVPDTKETYDKVEFAGIGAEKSPIVFKNVRLASGGGMNLIGKKFTDAKIVTHGINFDFNKASIKPESMGTLNMIVKIMQENPEIKFEVGGHSDGDGEDAYNLKLSQQRADAVREQLIKLGIDASRLTAKGYGESKPISDNTSPEGKANNRRVEFVKI